jgi:transcriptional regulator with XRE-family HTH domain/quercetin dioxygenase-like cupin family protein
MVSTAATSAPREASAPPEEATIRAVLGQRIRAARQERGLSTVQVARTVGVSPSLISQVERGLTGPSLDVLEGIARCLEVSIGALFDGGPAALGRASAGDGSAGEPGAARRTGTVGEAPRTWDEAVAGVWHGARAGDERLPAGPADTVGVAGPAGPAGSAGSAGSAGGRPQGVQGKQGAQGTQGAQVVRAGRRKMLGLPGSVTYELLSPDLKHQIELIWVEFQPGQKAPIYAHEGEEQMVVIRGRMHYWVAGETHVLEAGDCITIDASQPHGAANLDEQPATVVAAITPPSF